MPGLEILSETLASVPILQAPWLVNHELIAASPRHDPSQKVVPKKQVVIPTTPSYVPTHVKQVKTTQPKDMKAAKESRAQGKKDAKARKLQKE